ncbi:hypothetical protein K1719_022992 [Acacia pycnantha]|nr:hypothetical protein K1719_022992 [Acacia pycnantha]
MKIEKTVRGFSGVVNVKVDMSAKKLTVIGKVDPAKVRDALAEKNKKVEIVSPQPKKDAAGNKKPDDKLENKAHTKKEVKREVKEKEGPIKVLKLVIQETRQVIVVVQVEDISQELEEARNEAERARNEAERALNKAERARNKAECARNKAKHARNKAEHARNEAELARNEAEHARNVADIAQNKWIKAETDLQEKLELTQMPKLKCQETNVQEKLKLTQMPKLKCQETNVKFPDVNVKSSRLRLSDSTRRLRS